MADYDVDYYLSRVKEYKATSGEPEFDPKKLRAMKTGVKRRRALRDTPLTEDQRQLSESLIDNEPPDLWK
jgi:hypothetical protein